MDVGSWSRLPLDARRRVRRRKVWVGFGLAVFCFLCGVIQFSAGLYLTDIIGIVCFVVAFANAAVAIRWSCLSAG